MSSFAGVVVLYHPEADICRNIQTYVSELDILYILDNTENPSDNFSILDKIIKLQNVKYFPFYENKGLSYALNFALKKVQKEGYTYLLTMDQDSCFPGKEFFKYKTNIIHAENDRKFDNVAIFSVNYSGLKEAENLRGVHEVIAAITSGSILKVRLTEKIGYFDENLFIDEVDDEYCYRARLLGYKIIMYCDIKLTHHLGNPKKYCILGYRFTVLNHGAIRKYYISRNRLYVAKKYKCIRKYYIMSLAKMFIKILFFEKNKFTKIVFMVNGIYDFISNKYGKYTN